MNVKCVCVGQCWGTNWEAVCQTFLLTVKQRKQEDSNATLSAVLKHLADFTKQLGLFQDTSMHAYAYTNAHKKSSKPHNGNLPQVQAVFLWGLFILLKTEHPEFTGEAKFVLHQLISTVHMNNTLKLCFIFSFFTNPHQYRWYVKVSISVLSHLLCFLVLKPEWKMPSLLYTLSGYKYIRLRYELPGVTANLFSGSAALLCAKLQFWQ